MSPSSFQMSVAAELMLMVTSASASATILMFPTLTVLWAAVMAVLERSMESTANLTNRISFNSVIFFIFFILFMVGHKI